MTVRQKLGLILGSKVIKKLSLEKKYFAKKRPPRLIFLDKNLFEKFDGVLTLKIDFESTILALFDKL